MNLRRACFIYSIFTITVLAADNVLADQGTDYCYDVLIHELSDKKESSDKEESSLAIRHAHCAKNTLTVGGNYGVTSGDFGSSQSDCSSETSEQHRSSALWYANSEYGTVIDAWKACMTNRHEFACWAEKVNDAKHIIIHADWEIPGEHRPTLIKESSKIIVDHESSAGIENNLYYGDNIIPVSRMNPLDSIAVSISAQKDGVVKSCTTYVPPLEHPKPKKCHSIVSRQPYTRLSNGVSPASASITAPDDSHFEEAHCMVYHTQDNISVEIINNVSTRLSGGRFTCEIVKENFGDYFLPRNNEPEYFLFASGKYCDN